MEKEFLNYEQALALKELGFDEPCIATHGYLELYINTDDGHLKAPLYQQAFRWFREKYNLQCWPEPTGSDRYSCRYDGNNDIGKRYVGYLRDNLNNILFYKTYEEAELECLKKLIEITKTCKE